MSYPRWRQTRALLVLAVALASPACARRAAPDATTVAAAVQRSAFDLAHSTVPSQYTAADPVEPPTLPLYDIVAPPLGAPPSSATMTAPTDTSAETDDTPTTSDASTSRHPTPLAAPIPQPTDSSTSSAPPLPPTSSRQPPPTTSQPITQPVAPDTTLSVASSTSVPVVFATNVEAWFMEATNQARAEVGLPPLSVSSILTGYARNHAQVMAAARDLHHSPDLTRLFDRTIWHILGENVGVGASAESIQRALLASASHYANIVQPEFAFIGIGVVIDGSGFIWTCHNFAA